MKVSTITGVATLAVLTSACTTTGGEVPSMAEALSEITGQNGRACVDKADIQGYGVLEEDIISIDSQQDYYLATVLPGCTDLVTSIGVAFQGGFGEICGQTSDSVITNENTCTINQMYEFESRDEAFEAYNEALQQREELKEMAEND